MRKERKIICNKDITQCIHTRVVQNSSITITNYYITLPDGMTQRLF